MYIRASTHTQTTIKPPHPVFDFGVLRQYAILSAPRRCRVSISSPGQRMPCCCTLVLCSQTQQCRHSSVYSRVGKVGIIVVGRRLAGAYYRHFCTHRVTFAGLSSSRMCSTHKNGNLLIRHTLLLQFCVYTDVLAR